MKSSFLLMFLMISVYAPSLAQTTFLHYGPNFSHNPSVGYGESFPFGNNEVITARRVASSMWNTSVFVYISENGTEHTIDKDTTATNILYEYFFYRFNYFQKQKKAVYSISVNNRSQLRWYNRDFKLDCIFFDESSFIEACSDSSFFYLSGNKTLKAFTHNCDSLWQVPLNSYLNLSNIADSQFFRHSLHYLESNQLILSLTSESNPKGWTNFYINPKNGALLNWHQLSEDFVKKVELVSDGWIVIRQLTLSDQEKVELVKYDFDLTEISRHQINPHLAKTLYQSSGIVDDELLISFRIEDQINGINSAANEFQVYNQQLQLKTRRYFRATSSYTGVPVSDYGSVIIRNFTKTSDGGYFLNGILRPSTYDAKSFYMKLDSNLRSNDTLFLTGFRTFLSIPDTLWQIEGVSVIEHTPLQKPRLYPNPNSGIFTLQFQEEILPNNQVEIFDLMGKMVFQSSFNDNSQGIDANHLPNGVYFIHIKNSESGQILGTERLIINR